MRSYPALDIAWPTPPGAVDPDLVLAAIDEHQPVAVEDRAEGIRVFFSTAASRDGARDALSSFDGPLRLSGVEVDDENWAERSQAALAAITIGRIVVAPPWAPVGAGAHPPGAIHIVIEPSMGFGTGHHASTRLCLELVQRHPLHGGAVLDVGTGSGVLAIAAWRLGAASALGIDSDPDAIDAATDSVARNQANAHVNVTVQDVTQDALSLADRFDVTFANLTGGLLIRIASVLVATLAPGGRLVASGFQVEERNTVLAAFSAAGAELVDEASEESWVGVTVRRRGDELKTEN